MDEAQPVTSPGGGGSSLRLTKRKVRTPEEQSRIDERMRKLRDAKAAKRAERERLLAQGLREIDSSQRVESVREDQEPSPLMLVDESPAVPANTTSPIDATTTVVQDVDPTTGTTPDENNLRLGSSPTQHSDVQETVRAPELPHRASHAIFGRVEAGGTNREQQGAKEPDRALLGPWFNITRTPTPALRNYKRPFHTNTPSRRSYLDYASLALRGAALGFCLYITVRHLLSLYQEDSPEGEETVIYEKVTPSEEVSDAEKLDLPTPSQTAMGGRGGIVPFTPRKVDRYFMLSLKRQ